MYDIISEMIYLDHVSASCHVLTHITCIVIISNVSTLSTTALCTYFAPLHTVLPMLLLHFCYELSYTAYFTCIIQPVFTPFILHTLLFTIVFICCINMFWLLYTYCLCSALLPALVYTMRWLLLCTIPWASHFYIICLFHLP